MYEFQERLQNTLLSKFERIITKKGFESYKDISFLIEEIQDDFYREYKSETNKEASNSWRVWKGNLYEIMVHKLISVICSKNNIGAIMESDLNQNEDLKNQIELKYQGGIIIPDVDILLYNLKTRKVISILSCKSSFRDRISMVGYWAVKTHQMNPDVEYIFITMDNDNALTVNSKSDTKARLIIEDTDGAYVMNDSVKEGINLYHFNKFKNYIKNLN